MPVPTVTLARCLLTAVMARCWSIAAMALYPLTTNTCGEICDILKEVLEEIQLAEVHKEVPKSVLGGGLEEVPKGVDWKKSEEITLGSVEAELYRL